MLNSTQREAVGEAFSLDAKRHARTMTWHAVDAIADTGHRDSDFPHAIDKAGNLGDFDGAPATGPWILEIRKRASDTAIRRALRRLADASPSRATRAVSARRRPLVRC